MGNRKVFDVLKNRIEYHLNLLSMAEREKSGPDMIKIFEIYMDEDISVACRMLEMKLIKHEQYRILYELHMEYISQKNKTNNLRPVTPIK